MAIDYNQRIPNNVGLSDDRRLRRALESWLPGYLSWWDQLGPEGTQNFDVYLRTAISVDQDGWAHYDFVKMPDYRWGIVLAEAEDGRVIPFGDHKGEKAWQEVPGEYRSTLRRLIVHHDVRDALMPRLKRAYETVPIGNPLDDGVLVGPLIDEAAFAAMEAALARAVSDGGTVAGGGRALAEEYGDAFYAKPALVDMPSQTEVVREETFAPILYVMTYRELDEAIALHNDVPQGLSSGSFSTDVRETETFL